MFSTLSEKLSGIFSRLRSRGTLSEDDVNAALREIRIALLEADVALPVVKDFIETIRQAAVGQEVIRSVSPGQMVVKIVHDHLIKMLGGEAEPLNLAATTPFSYMIVGLQGSGKTTSTAKIAKRLSEKDKKRVLMASLDVYRPAAQEQLEILGKQLGLASLPIVEGETPLAIAKRAMQTARIEGYDVVLLDTAGRLHIDEPLMAELETIKAETKPLETLLVADSMTGQDAVTIARNFHERITLTGVILTRVDGDARGGAALSIRAVTGCPIKLMGLGEKLDQLEVFQPARIAGRILDMGDVVSLVEKAAETISQEDAEKMSARFQKGRFDLNDMAKYLEQMLKMGGMPTIMSFLPGMGKIKDKLASSGMDDKVLRRQLAIIRSMTPKERKNPSLFNASRRRRVAMGSGTEVSDVNRLLKQAAQMQEMMKHISKLGGKGLLRKGLTGGLKGLFQ